MTPGTTVSSLLDSAEIATDERRHFASLLGLSPGARIVEAIDGSAGHPDASVDAVLCIDAIAHVRDRAAALANWARSVKPGGRILYTDPAIVAGLVTSDELAGLGSMGLFVFAPQGENELLIESAGLRLLRADDATDTLALASAHVRAERSRRADTLTATEGRERFDERQLFLETLQTMLSERRLARISFLAEKPR